MQRSKSIWPRLDLLGQVLGADDIGTGGLGLVRLVAAREHRDAQRLAGPVRQVDRAAHHLVGVPRVHAQGERQLDRLVELGRRGVLDRLHRVRQRVHLVAVESPSMRR